MKNEKWPEQAPLLGLVVLMLLVFGLQNLPNADWYESLMAVPAKIVQSWDNLLAGSAAAADLHPAATLLSYAFLHADAEHILYNMLFLWIFAGLTAGLLGQRWMITIFLLTAIAGGIAHTLLNPTDHTPMLGASGAVMGFEGAYLGLALRWRLPDPHIWPMARPIPPAHLAALAVIGIVMDFMGIMNHHASNIAYGAHIGGFLMGLLLTTLIVPKPRQAA